MPQPHAADASIAAARVRPALAERALCALTVLLWAAVAAWLLAGAPAPGRWLGLPWLALGLLWPPGFYLTLAAALPWFGNNPGGPHHLYLIELAAMGPVMRHFAERAAGRVARRPSRLDPWLWAFVAVSWVCLLPQARWLWVEFYHTRGDFLFIIYSHYVTSGTLGLQLALKLTLAAGLVAHLRDRPWSARRIEFFLRLMLGFLLLSAAAGLLNYFGWLPLEWWRGENPDLVRFGYPRLQSLYWHSGWFVQYVVALAPALLVLAWTARGRRARIAGWAGVALLTLATLLTMQRAGWLALAAGYGVALAGLAWLAHARPQTGAAQSRLKRILQPSAIIVALLLALAALNADFRARAGEMFRYHHRADIWAGAAGMIREFPLGGAGLGNFYRTHQMLYRPGHPLHEIRDKGTAHNLFLHVWAERGVAGLIALLGVLGLCAAGLGARLGELRRRRKPAQAARVELALAGGLTALVIDGIFQYIFYVRVIELLFWLFVGWCAAAMTAEDRRAERAGLSASKSPNMLRSAWLLPLLCAATLAVVAWENYPRLAPWQIGYGGINTTVAGQRAEIALPPGGDRWILPLVSIDPSMHMEPVEMVVTFEGWPVEVVLFEEHGLREVEIELPRLSREGDALVVHASRTWSPFLHGQRDIPLLEIGVMHGEVREMNN